MVIDHTSYSVSEIEGDHTLIASDHFIKSDVILGEEKIQVSFYVIFSSLITMCTIFGYFIFALQLYTSECHWVLCVIYQAPLLFRGIAHSVNAASSLVSALICLL